MLDPDCITGTESRFALKLATKPSGRGTSPGRLLGGMLGNCRENLARCGVWSRDCETLDRLLVVPEREREVPGVTGDIEYDEAADRTDSAYALGVISAADIGEPKTC